MACERRPLALVEQVVIADRMWRVRVDDHEIGKPAFSHVAPLADAEDVGRGVTGTLDDNLGTELAVPR